MIRSHTVRKGEIAVQRAILRALELGLTPSRPCAEGARYDLIVDGRGGPPARVQVKYCDHRPRSPDAYEVSLSRHNGGRNRRLYRYARGEIDAVIALLASHGQLVWLPQELWADRWTVTLRTGDALNNQRRRTHLAADFRW